MQNEARNVLAQGRKCPVCHVHMGTHEEAVEVNKVIYHQKCNPFKRAPQPALNCRIKVPIAFGQPA